MRFAHHSLAEVNLSLSKQGSCLEAPTSERTSARGTKWYTMRIYTEKKRLNSLSMLYIESEIMQSYKQY